FGVLFILCMYGILLTYFFPIYVHFNLSLTEYLKWPLIIGIIHPILSIFLLGILGVGIYVLLMTVPSILFFFVGSTAAYIIMWGILPPKKKKIDRKSRRPNSSHVSTPYTGFS